MNTVAFAKQYIGYGWAVFPLAVREKLPLFKAAHAPGSQCHGECGALGHGLWDATKDENIATGWFEFNERANIGIACGKQSGIVVLDVDALHGGYESLEVLQSEYGRIPETVIAETGGGGEHIFFKHPGGADIRNIQASAKLGSGLDIRGDGGYIAAAPSIHPNGKPYKWLISPDDMPLADMPQWIIDKLKQPVQKSELPVVANGRIANGARNNTLASIAGSMRKRGLDSDAIAPALKIHNEKYCVPPLPETEVEAIASSMQRYQPSAPVFVAENPDTVMTLRQALSAAYDATDKAGQGFTKCVKTGFADVDFLLDDGLYSPDVMILAARPGQGKTALLTNIALNAAKAGKRVGFFTLEMGNVQIAMRLISMLSGVSFGKQRKGKMDNSEWPLYTHAIGELENLPITLCDLPAITVSGMRQKITDYMGEIDLLCFDYLQLGGSEKKHNTREQEVSEVSAGLKTLAKEFNVPIIGAAQLSRAVETRAEKRPILSDLRESGSIENDADIVTFIYRPDQYEKDSAKQNVAEFIVAKHRNGPVGTVELVFRSALTKFENAAKKQIYPNGREDYTDI